jgi:hypothetical protein
MLLEHIFIDRVYILRGRAKGPDKQITGFPTLGRTNSVLSARIGLYLNTPNAKITVETALVGPRRRLNFTMAGSDNPELPEIPSGLV